MSQNLEFFYEQELDFIRNLSGEFARDRPKIADRLLLDASRSQDPHVERMIEAFALIAARVRKKLDDEFPEITEALLQLLYPHYLAPIPSMAIAQFEPDPSQGQLTGGYTIAPRTNLYSPEVKVGTRRAAKCRFRTAYPVTLWPLRVQEARMQLPPFNVQVELQDFFRLPQEDPKSLVRLELAALPGANFAELELDRLRFFLHGEDRTVNELYELLMNHTIGIVAQGEGGRAIRLPQESLRPVGFGMEEGMLGYGSQSFLGYRLLTEFFCFPQKFFFFDVTGLDRILWQGEGKRLELMLFLDRAVERLEPRVETSTFRLFCTPIVNLFHQQADPIRVTHFKSEYRVVPDVRHPDSMEVYSVDGLYSTDANTGESIRYRPFYASHHAEMDDDSGHDCYWFTTRRPSLRKNDEGTDVFLSLVNLDFDPRLPPAEVLSPALTCTNRDLPRSLRDRGGQDWGFQLEGQAPIKRIAPVVLPTSTLRLSQQSSRWRLISHLSLNHLSISDRDAGAGALREILTLYDYQATPATAQMISGVVSVHQRRKAARVVDPNLGPTTCRGLEIEIELDPSKFTGSGVYLFAAVLDEFLRLYANVNSFTQLVSRRTGESEPFRRWPTRVGDKTLI